LSCSVGRVVTFVVPYRFRYHCSKAVFTGVSSKPCLTLNQLDPPFVARVLAQAEIWSMPAGCKDSFSTSAPSR
jgi:hypothetical protein